MSAAPEALTQDKTTVILAEGHGVVRAKENGSILYDGHWMNGFRQGDGDALIFTRDDRKDRPVFIGRYSGKWRAGMRDGMGVLLEVNGEKYEGEWKYDMRNGVGND